MDKQQREQLAQQIREAMDRKGWSQAELSRQSGVSENTVSAILNVTGQRNNAGKLRAVLDALDIEPVAQIIDLSDTPEDVRLFLTIAAQRLSVMDQADRDRLLADLYPRIVLTKS